MMENKMQDRIEVCYGFFLNRETVLESGRFAILWNAFEANQCNFDCSNTKLRQFAQMLVNNRLQKHRKLEAFAIELKNRAKFLKLVVEEYVNSRLFSKNGKGRNETDMEAIKLFINSEGKESPEGGLLAIYRIRNNMFHGLKGFYDLDNQIGLFKTINEILEEIA